MRGARCPGGEGQGDVKGPAGLGTILLEREHTTLPSSSSRCTAGVRHSPFVCAFIHSFITVTVDSGVRGEGGR